MATHSSVLAWRIPGTGEPGGLLSMGSHRVGHDWSDLAAAAKVLEFQLSISPSNEYLGLISFRIDWFDLFAVQMALKSLLQHHSSKASILHLSAFFMVHSHIYFSSSHVCMWKMDRKEGWELKNWCFWIVMPEKTLESPLDCKKIKLLGWWKSNGDFGPWILNHLTSLKHIFISQNRNHYNQEIFANEK